MDPIIREKLLEYIKEDMYYGNPFKIPEIPVTCEVISKDEGVLAGMAVVRTLFEMVGIEVVESLDDGERIGKGDVVLELKGSARDVFSVERVALNIVMRMSGIATAVSEMVERARRVNPKVIIAGTRKTTPGFRLFEKMAIEIGGGDPHRYSLSDCVIVKRNVTSILGVEKAVEIAKRSSFTKKIEVEVDNVDDAVKVAELGVDAIMFDNMSPEDIRRCVEEIESRGLRERIILEASGGITPENVEEYAKTGVDVISSGYITCSARWLDFSLRAKPLLL